MAKKVLVEEMREKIDRISIIDPHEHIRKRTDLVREGANLFMMAKYGVFFPDLINAGMPAHLWDTAPASEDEIWERIGPYIENIQNTGYYRTLMVAFKDLYNFSNDEITGENWQTLSRRITKAYQREDWYDFVMRKRLNIEVAFLDAFWEPGYLDRDGLFVPGPGMDPFVWVRSGRHFTANAPSVFSPSGWWPASPIDDIRKKWGVGFETLDEYLALIDLALSKVRDNGGHAIKLRVAYNRDLQVSKVSRTEAEAIFCKTEEDLTAEDAKHFEDYAIRTVIEKATELNFPVQLHTGMHGIPGNPPQRGNPLQLVNLLMEYPRTKFILFHASYPFVGEMASLVKSFPNAYLDICWMPWLLDVNLTRYLKEWLAVLPCSKMMVSGDAETVERAYSAFVFAKRCFAEALADYVEEGLYSKETAARIAEKVFRKNAQAVYSIPESAKVEKIRQSARRLSQ